MRVLFLSHRFPYPPTFGSKVRAFNMIRHLGERHQVSVFSLVRSVAEEAEAAGIAPYCSEFRTFRLAPAVQAAKVALTLPTPWPASEAYFHSGPMQREVGRQLSRRSFDCVVAHCSAVGRYVEGAEQLPKLIDYCDVDSQKWRDYAAFKPWPASAGYGWEAWRMERAERRLAGRFDAVTVATPGELNSLAELGIRDRADWFGNGVDLEYFSPGIEAPDNDLITFVGRMDYYPNEQCMVDFCSRVWPSLRRARPGLRLQIVGAEPTSRVRALGSVEGVTVTGAVPDVRPYVRRSALSIVPLQIARGTQNKILESMAMGVPVLCSSVAAAGVDVVRGEHLAIADSSQEWCERVLGLLEDARERERLTAAGRERVQSRHSWSGALGRFDQILDRCLRLPRSGVQLSAAT